MELQTVVRYNQSINNTNELNEEYTQYNSKQIDKVSKQEEECNRQNKNGEGDKLEKEVERKLDIKEKLKLNPEYIPSVAEKNIIKAIEEANKKVDGKDKRFELSIHEKTKQILIKVLDSETGEIIREIPSEKILDIVASMCESAGLFIDEKI